MFKCFALISSLFVGRGLSEETACNYLYEVHTARAYPIDECLTLGSNSNIKYQCTESAAYPSNYTITLQSFNSDDCDSATLLQSLDLNEWIDSYNAQQRNLSMSIAYQCGGTNDCFFRFNNRCADDGDGDDTNNDGYYPLKQCLNNYNDSSSFRVECDAVSDTFSYFKFDGVDCVDSALDIDASVVQVESSECMDFAECRDTPFPTISPSMPPTFFPTAMPSRAPSYDVPFWNKSLDRAIDILSNGTQRSSAEQRSHALLVGLTVMVALVMESGCD